jgi:hypothetical protein
MSPFAGLVEKVLTQITLSGKNPQFEGKLREKIQIHAQ